MSETTGRNARGRGVRGRGRGRGRGRSAAAGSRSHTTTNNHARGGRGETVGNDSGSRREAPSGERDGRGGRGGRGSTSSFDPNKKPLKNGEKGAEAHTVSEADRIRFTKILMQLREGDETRLEFPPTLTNTERKFMHQLAMQLGLVSKSTGKGDDRRIVVTKRMEHTKSATALLGESSSSLPMLQIGTPGLQALQEHMTKFPPSHADVLESVETGATLVEAFSGGAGVGEDEGGEAAHDARIAVALKQLGLGQEERMTMATIKPKYVNLGQRQARHAAFQTAKRQSPHYSRMVQQRKKLPAYARQEEIVATVAKCPVTIIQGETGCGKSTQCPQFLLDANPTANIVVTQREFVFSLLLPPPS